MNLHGSIRTGALLLASTMLVACGTSSDDENNVNDNPNPTNQTPTISGSPESMVTTGNNYMFIPSASDADGDALTFSVANDPAWTSFSTSTGMLSGTPSVNDVGIHSGIIISVSDGAASASLPVFSIEVTDSAGGNQPPVISGSPPVSVVAGSIYSFTPTASDSDNDPLTFSITNQPSWTSFSASTGSLTGVPEASDIGTYSGIVISVSDGADSANLPPFAITVEAIMTGSAMMTWVPPITNSNGSPLTDLAGHRIHYGTSPGIYTTEIEVPGAGVASYTVDGLAPGTYYFAVGAYNTAGGEGPLSNEDSKTIP